MDTSDNTRDAGASTDVHVTGADETGAFTTDWPPGADTPAGGSSNAGINRTGANLATPTADAAPDRQETTEPDA